jgi:FdrA protein
MTTELPMGEESRTPKAPRVKSLEAALEIDPALSLALISLPGPLAAQQAHRAIEMGLHVFLFSGDISLADEVALKREATSRGLIVMGPYCGTALIDGVPLGFVNRVPRGPVGVVGASGTGIQEVVSLLAARGLGISHAIGTGGRDLSSEVGGLSALFAIEALGRDPATEVIVLLSKPPAKAVADRVLAAAKATGKPVVACFLGSNAPAPPPSRPSSRPPAPPPSVPPRDLGTMGEPAVFGTLEGTVLAVAQKLGREAARRDTVLAEPISRAPWQRRVIGYFTGGSLAHEAIVVLSSRFDVSTNLGEEVGNPADSGGHTVIDLGDDEYTRGRGHPMIDPSLRNQLIEQIADDPTALVLLVDVVLGHGAHPNPAAELVSAIRVARAGVESRGGALHVVASVTGTEADPQVRSLQVATLEREGVIVAPSNAAAARAALGIVKGGQS